MGALGWTGVFALFVVALPFVNVWLGRAAELQPLRGTSSFKLRLEFWEPNAETGGADKKDRPDIRWDEDAKCPSDPK